MDPRHCEIVRSLFKMAWIDGQISEKEVWVLGRLMEQMGLTLAQRLILADGFLHEPDLSDVRLDEVLHDHPSRLLAMELLITVCLSDSEVADAELGFLQEMATRLSISGPELETLRQRSQSSLAGH